MLIKLDIKRGCGVTGLSFHSERSWVLVGLHNGEIEIWDYCSGFLIDTFRGDRKGAVRSVDFHKVQPFFVSGGDDCEVKVWNYKRFMFSLVGHGDRVNSVQFHEKKPWIISGGNDQKLRIWNWESQVCIYALNMAGKATCVSFHPNPEEYCALSVTDRGVISVWEISLFVVKPPSVLARYYKYLYHEVFAWYAITWASFHPTLPLIVSGGNDGQVEIWKMPVITMPPHKLRSMGTLRGHMHSISGVLFHARHDVIVSNSQDKTIRVWDRSKGTCLGAFSRQEAFLCLALHPSSNLLGASHDNGFMVFKLASERPAFSVTGDSLLFVKNGVLHVFDYLTQKDVELMSLSTPCSDSLKEGRRTLHYNPVENALLICSDMESDYYELYAIPEESCFRGNSVQQAKRGIGGLSVFVERNRFAVLSKSCNDVFIKNLNNDTVKKIVLPMATDIIFPAGSGKLLCGTEDRVVMFDLHQQIVLGNLQTSFIRYVVWACDMESVALLGKYSIVIADKKLVPQCKVDEKSRVKSGTWDHNGVFLYTTQRHIKYCLPNGEMGIIKTLDVPKYITKIYGNTIFCLDRDGKICPIIVDSTEYMFKLSLLMKRYDEAMEIIRNSKLYGQAMITYLKQKGLPEVALHFVKDERSRFSLALESGNFQMAIASAKEIADEDCWNKLGAEAIRQGHTGIAEYVYERAKDFKRLSFLYLITGNLDKLLKVMRTSEVKNDVVSQFHQALYLGDIQERIKILEDAGHLPLAYVTASVHGLFDVAERLAVALAGYIPSLLMETSASLLIPSKPLLCGRDWPHLVVNRGVFERGPDNFGRGSNIDYRDAADADFGETSVTEEMDNAMTIPNTESSAFSVPTPGMPFSQIWVEDSSDAAEHAAAGDFEAAVWMLSERYGMKKFGHFKSLFIDLYLGSQTFMCAFASAPVISAAMNRCWNELTNSNVHGKLALVFNCSGLRKKFEVARQLLTAGRFSDAFHSFRNVLHIIPLTMVGSEKDTAYIQSLKDTVKNYLLVTKMKLKQRELMNNLVRQLELAAYSTHIPLNPHDTRLVLFSAMTDCYKAGNRRTAAKFCSRLLHANSSTDVQSKTVDQALQDFKEEDRIDVQGLNNDSTNLFKSASTDDEYSKAAKQVLQDRKANTRDAWQLNYDSTKPFKICGLTLSPIYEGETSVFCPYCKADFFPSQKDQICSICDLAMVVDTSAFSV